MKRIILLLAIGLLSCTAGAQNLDVEKLTTRGAVLKAVVAVDVPLQFDFFMEQTEKECKEFMPTIKADHGWGRGVSEKLIPVLWICAAIFIGLLVLAVVMN